MKNLTKVTLKSFIEATSGLEKADVETMTEEDAKCGVNATRVLVFNKNYFTVNEHIVSTIEYLESLGYSFSRYAENKKTFYLI